jgi:carboxymethylenebutenolidase
MKSICLTCLLFLLAVTSNAQHSCCSMFAALADDPAFVSAHLPPLPFIYKPESGKMISIKSPDGKDASAFEVKGTGGNYILMFHEWWGLNDYMKRQAERLNTETGATVLALDLFDSRVTTDPAVAGSFTKNTKEERIRAIISGAIDYAGKTSRIQTIGWCYGGGWSLQAALMCGPSLKGCVMYYGMPETDKHKLMKLSAPLLGFFAQKDQWITPQAVNEFKFTLEEMKKDVTIYFYDADHAFANPSNPNHDAKAADDAWMKAIAFINANFK